ncbi:serine/threonine-protein kinase [Hyalangium gracile]|uniref:serine/threonine-protein kinase n=1 Tax=Hyalangium gracile TaxID=394092 RepID=UPI001CD00BDF|nr:serine/threonine-protein kinase [Hyalangium gracile]
MSSRVTENPMGRQRQPSQEVDPLALPLGTQVGPWQVVGFGGRGAYGSLYRVKRAGEGNAGPFALKLAIHPRDERFAREASLLSRIRSAHVPRLQAQGLWEHASGVFPYLVMEWAEGEPLYEWAARRNPSLRQMLRVLAQVARALEATHATGSVHRDVKGANVLVRPADAWVTLTDFGAGHYRGAATLTSKLLPPGTPTYRSPEAWAFLRTFLRHPTAHYPASACDDLFAFGVMAYRLLTDEYPPLTHPEEPGAEVWREGGPGPRPPSELNPQVSREVDALILRLLATAPVERFHGQAREAAEALQQAAEGARAEADAPMFRWGDAHQPRWRSPEAVRLAEERDVAAREQLTRRRAEARARTTTVSRSAVPRTLASPWRVAAAVALLGGVIAMIWASRVERSQEGARATPGMGPSDDGSVAVGDSAQNSSGKTFLPEPLGERVSPAGEPLPQEPLPGQRKPPCRPNGEVELRGGCWNRIDNARPPCEEYAYEWNEECYLPAYANRRRPAADKP